jgi:creatinine deaminase
MMNDQESFAIAIEEAKLSYKEGGIPVIASVITSSQVSANRAPLW